MKRYTDYSDIELANMSEEQLENLIDIECMVNGAPISIQEPVLVHVPEIEEPKEEAFSLDIGTVMVMSFEEAESIKNLINSLKTRVISDYDYSRGNKRKYIKPYEDTVSFTKGKYYSKAAYSNLAPLLDSVKKAEDTNKERRELFKESVARRNKIESEVMNAYYDALEYKSGLIEAKAVYEKYVELSDGDTEIAKNFFFESDYSDYYEEVVGKEE